MKLARVIAFAAVVSAASAQSFEVASIREDQIKVPPSIGPAPGNVRFVARNMPLLWLVGEAYGIANGEISGLPEPLSSARYDIDAKAEHPANREQMRAMLRALLQDRFRISTHRETKERKVYVLEVAGGGTKLTENRDGVEFSIRKISGNKTAYHNIPMSLFANVLAGAVDDVVVDQTGLSGSYDFTLDYARDRVGQGVLDGREPAPDPTAPSLVVALRDQLGLKLETRRTAVSMLVIDHIERPSAN